MQDLQNQDSYKTNENQKLTAKRFFGGLRFSLNYQIMKILYNCKKLSLKGKFDAGEYLNQSYNLLKTFEAHGAKFQVDGIQKLKQDGPCVIVANHMSLLETQVLPWFIGCFSPLSIVMKQSLYDSWLFHPVAVATKSIAITRKNLRADIDTIMDEGCAYLKEGRSILLFPEGTRKLYFDRKEFNSLGVKLASRAGVKLIPIALKTDFLINGKRFSDYGIIQRDKNVNITIGDPLEVQGRGKKEHSEVLDFLESTLSGWGVEVKGSEA